MPSIGLHDTMMAWVSLLTSGSSLAADLNVHLQQELGISLPEQDLLKQLAQAGGTITMTELAHRIFLSKAGMTKMVDRLASAGLVRRVPSTSDRRAVTVLLTAKGRRVVRRSWELIEPWVEANFRAHLTDREIRSLGRALESLLRGRGIWGGLQDHLRGYPGGSKGPTLADKLRTEDP